MGGGGLAWAGAKARITPGDIGALFGDCGGSGDGSGDTGAEPSVGDALGVTQALHGVMGAALTGAFGILFSGMTSAAGAQNSSSIQTPPVPFPSAIDCLLAAKAEPFGK